MKLRIFGTHSRMRLEGTPTEFSPMFGGEGLSVPETRKVLKNVAKDIGLATDTKGKQWWVEGSWDEISTALNLPATSPSILSQQLKAVMPNLEVTLIPPKGALDSSYITPQESRDSW